MRGWMIYSDAQSNSEIEIDFYSKRKAESFPTFAILVIKYFILSMIGWSWKKGRVGEVTRPCSWQVASS